ncbi:hypothetical protein QQ045_030881 [Rhodiola kirilowii]
MNTHQWKLGQLLVRRDYAETFFRVSGGPSSYDSQIPKNPIGGLSIWIEGWSPVNYLHSGGISGCDKKEALNTALDASSMAMKSLTAGKFIILVKKKDNLVMPEKEKNLPISQINSPEDPVCFKQDTMVHE